MSSGKKIYTKTGDGGETSLGSGRVSKNSPGIEAVGAVDEAVVEELQEIVEGPPVDGPVVHFLLKVAWEGGLDAQETEVDEDLHPGRGVAETDVLEEAHLGGDGVVAAEDDVLGPVAEVLEEIEERLELEASHAPSYERLRRRHRIRP